MSSLRNKAGVRRWILVTLVCMALLGGTYATWPWWSVALVRAALAPTGIGVEELVMRRPGTQALVIEQFTLIQRTNAYALRVQGRHVILRYQWNELWHGRLSALHADAIAIALKPLPQLPTATTSPWSIPLESPSALLARLPVAAITLPVLTVDAQLAAGDQHFSGSADYIDGVLQLYLADTGKPQLSAHLRADRRDQVELTVQSDQMLLAQLNNRIESPRRLQGALLVQLEPLSALLQDWGLLNRAAVLSGAVNASWRGPLPAVIDAVSWRSAALTGEFEAHIAASDSTRHGALNLLAEYALTQGVITVNLKQADGSGTLPAPALLEKPLALPAAQPLQVDVRADAATLRIALQPLQLQWSGAVSLTVAAPQRALQGALTLTDPVIGYDSDWHLDTHYQAQLSFERFNLASYRAQRAHLQMAGAVAGSLAQGSLRVAPGAQLSLQSNRWSGGSTGPVSIRTAQPMEMVFTTDRLLLPAAQLDIGPTAVTQGSNSYRFAAAQLALRDGAVDSHAIDAATGQLTLRIIRLSAPVGPYRIQPVAVQADLKAAQRVVQGSWSVRAPNDLLTVRGTLRHALADGRGEATATLSPLTFKESGRYLPALLTAWPYPLDFSGGQFGFNARAQWRPAHWSARLDLDVRDVAGFYKLNLFKGLTTHVRADYADGALQIPATPLTVDEVDAGIALHRLRLTAAVTAPDVLRVRDLQAQLLGGRMYQNEFSYRWRAAENTIPLLFEAIQLSQLLTLEQNIDGSGILDGSLPVTLNAQGIAVQNGSFQARAPGGVIRYIGKLPQSALASVPALQLALDSLKNFHYTVLNVSADYAPAGDLALRTELHGRNPDLVEARPVHFNLNIRENIPDLLRSIQLSRDISDSIEQRIQDFYQHQPGEPAR